jgi:hypothetical protein
MKKGELTNGTKVFVLKIEHFVSLDVFARALGNELYDSISQDLEEIIFDFDKIRYRSSIDFKSFESQLDELLGSSSFIKTLNKKRAEELLRWDLKFYGKKGSIDDFEFEASYERSATLNKCHEITRKWVMEKYPHLISND